MSRKARRIQERINKKPKYSLEDMQKAMNIAIEMKRLTRGHLYMKNNPERCVFCGFKSSKKECRFWFMTFMDRWQSVLLNPTFFHDKEIEAIWIQPEYQDIKLPVNLKDQK